MTRFSTWARAGLSLVIALGAAVAVLSVPSAAGPAAPDLELAADTNAFDAGNIISDSMFFDYNALSAQQVQSFIAAKGASCVSTTGIPCLKDYRENTWSRSADGICDGNYPGAVNESAGTIIWKVAQACRTSPKVLLVLLQKEQALITASGSSLTARRYQIAAGMGCPDTAACDTQYYGFYNQVYSAAHQYQRYATYPKNYSYRAGQWNTVQWSPNSSCGSSQVWIANQATAGLYDYTPYRPNSAALRAGYGTGDGCSAYGNRNFWLYFTDWFGSTQSPGGDAILAAYAASGGESGPLGPYTSWVFCGLVGGGCGEAFQNGTLYWSPATGVHSVSGATLTAWTGRESGPLGYPTSDYFCGLRDGGCGQAFQNGRIFSSPATGTHTLTGAIQASWIAQGLETGPLGYPTSDGFCGLTGNGCAQAFEGGRIFFSPATGAHAVTGPIQDGWVAQGLEKGPLGYPTTDIFCGLAGGGCGQAFQGGRIFSSPASGTHAVTGAIQDSWIARGLELSALGYPSGDVVCGLTGGGCKQAFQGGTLYSSSAGTFAAFGAIATAWQAVGTEGGTLGYPVTDVFCGLRDGGCGQAFQGGRIFSSPAGGTHAVTGPIQDSWIAQGLERSPLGYPTGDLICGLTGGGCKQAFQGGTAYSSAAGTFAVSGAIATAWQAVGNEGGTLHYPITDIFCGLTGSGCGQAFQGGRIFSSPAGGTHAVTGPIQDSWIAQGLERGPLGYPTGDLICGLTSGGCKQAFQGGTLYSQPSAGTFAVSGAIATAWQAVGTEGGTLGYPITGIFCGLRDGGCGQAFQRGRIFSSPAGGTHAVTGAIQASWIAQGLERSSLGYPTGDLVCGLADGGCKQAFQGGTLYTHPTAGTFAVSGAIATAWQAVGNEGGTLGYPITGSMCGLRNGGCAQAFQGGRIFASPAGGTHAVTGPIQDSWIAQGLERGSLGYPTSDPYPVTGGTAQDFEGGKLVLNTTSGTVTRG